MSCHRYQVDLSHCLDGRLPGARRAEVLAHTDRCAECAEVWVEMQAAQSLVFGMKELRVSAAFREGVWNRIHSGEGAPEILLQEPISVATKIRYGMVGAAAAAVLLLGTHLLTRDESPQAPQPNGTDVADLGSNDEEDAASTELQFGPQGPPESHRLPETRLPEPVRAQAEVADMERPFAAAALSAGHLASKTVKKVSDAARRLHLRRDRILEGSFDQDRVLHQQVVTDVKTIEDGLTLISYWQNKELVRLEPASRECITIAEHTLHNFRSDARQRAIVLVRGLDSCSLDALENGVRVMFRPRELEQPQQLELIMDMFSNVKYREAVRGLFQGTDVQLMYMSGDPVKHFEWTQRNGGVQRSGKMMIRVLVDKAKSGEAPPTQRPDDEKKLRRRN